MNTNNPTNTAPMPDHQNSPTPRVLLRLRWLLNTAGNTVNTPVRLCCSTAIVILSTLLYSAASDEAVADTGSNDTIQQILLVDMTGPEVLDLLEELTDRRIVAQQNLPQVKINFNSRGPISRADAILAIESLLSLNGIAITEMGEGFLRALPAATISRQSPDLLMGPISNMHPSQRIFARIYPLDYLTVTRAAELIRPVLTQADALTPMAGSNSVLITDTLTNLQRVDLLVERFDRASTLTEDVVFLQLTNTSATDIQSRIEQLRATALKDQLRENTVIVADERSNQLIVVAHPSEMPLVRSLVDQLDIQVDPRTSSDVFYIQHGEAVRVVEVLRQLIDGQTSTVDRVRTRRDPGETVESAGDRPQSETRVAESTTFSTEPASGPNLQFSEFVTIVADERSNAIVAYGTPSDIRQLATLIGKIDVILAQVRIEVVIAEVSLSDGEVSGLSSFGISVDVPGSVPAGDVSFRTVSPSVLADGQPAFAYSGSINPFSLDMVFRTARTKSNVKILSAPTIVTTHNQEAEINVSESRPIITGSTTDVINPNSVRSTVQFRDIGIILKVKPLIGRNGIIQMEIDQTVENVIDTTEIDGNAQPIIGKRQATSFVSLADQEVLVLGGLQSVESSDTRGRVYMLGDIPIIGQLFRPRTQRESTKELIIFIKPYIVKSLEEVDLLSEQDLANSLVGDGVRQYFQTGRMPTYRIDTTTIEEAEEPDLPEPPKGRMYRK